MWSKVFDYYHLALMETKKLELFYFELRIHWKIWGNVISVACECSEDDGDGEEGEKLHKCALFSVVQNGFLVTRTSA